MKALLITVALICQANSAYNQGTRDSVRAEQAQCVIKFSSCVEQLRQQGKEDTTECLAKIGVKK